MAKNRLNVIYTRSGDDGMTSLGSMRLKKSHERIAVLGDIDELNSHIGVLLAHTLPEQVSMILRGVIQNRLFDLGGEIACFGDSLLISESDVKQLEAYIDGYNQSLPPLREFILPGANMPSALCHVCRSVCRRAERSMTRLEPKHPNAHGLCYLNRLSDLLFVLARILNDSEETFWDH